jgi:uncharacterized protein
MKNLLFILLAFLLPVSLIAQRSLDEKLLEAAENGDKAKVTTLLASGANIEAKSEGEKETPLMKAAYSGKFVMVNFLLLNGANIEAVDFNGNTVLGLMCGNTYLLDSVAMVDLQMIRLLVSKGAKLESRDDQGTTPLMSASWAGNDDIVKFLLSKGANVAAKDNEGRSSLYWARLRNHPSTVRILLEKGAK